MTTERLSPLLTDLYEVTMTYSYFQQNRHKEDAVFDCFFRKNPFQGQYTIFAGLSDVIEFVNSFQFTKNEIDYLCHKDNLDVPKGHKFREYLKNIHKDITKKVKIYALEEGTVAFPRIPVIRVEGPLGVCQLFETPILNLTGYASLVTTNAARMRQVVGEKVKLLEFGLRRAQGPNGGTSASKYAVMGGFNGTSNCLAGHKFGLNISGTLAHAYVSSFKETTEVPDPVVKIEILKKDVGINFLKLVHVIQEACSIESHVKGNKDDQLAKQMYASTNPGELRAFACYAIAFSNKFLALVDTYNTLASGVPNFLMVSLALMILNKQPLGIRLDSGDLKDLSNKARTMFNEFKSLAKAIVESEKFKAAFQNTLGHKLSDVLQNTVINFDDMIDKFVIVASNDLNETSLKELMAGGDCEINSFGIGTHLVTCQAQPALGMVYKLVETDKQPCIKFSEEKGKQTFPGSKAAFRLYNNDGQAIGDVLQGTKEQGMLDEAYNGESKRTSKFINISTLEEETVDFYKVEALHKRISRSQCVSDVADFVKASLKKIKPDILIAQGKLASGTYPTYFTKPLFEDIERLKNTGSIKA